VNWVAPAARRKVLIGCSTHGCRRVLTVKLVGALDGERPFCAPCSRKRDGVPRKVNTCRKCHQPKKGHTCTVVAQVSA
jgi:hypothetical protein